MVREAGGVERRLKLNDLRVLVAIAEAGSMNKAAQMLGTSQPAISRAVSDLEHAFGVRLFDRGPQGILPTPYGQALLKRSAAVFDEIRLGVEDLESLADPESGEVRVATTVNLAGGLVAAVIERLARHYPRIVCHLAASADGGSDAFGRLERREVDLVLAFFPAPIPEDRMEAQILYDDPLFVVASKDNPWARRRKVKLSELIEEPWTLPDAGTLLWSPVEEIFREAGLAMPAAKMISASGVARVALVAKSRFLTITAESVFRFAGRDMGVKALQVEIPRKTRPVAIVTLRNRTLTPAARLFIEAAQEVARPLRRQ